MTVTGMRLLSAVLLAILPLSNANCVNGRRVVESLSALVLNRDVYDRKFPPYLAGSSAVRVSIGIRGADVTEVDYVSQDFTINFVFSEAWLDPRLNYEKLNACKNSDAKNVAVNITLNNNLYENLWTPDICFFNSKTAFVHRSPFKNLQIVVLEQGFVYAEYRATIIGPCNLQLASFPMDRQECSITFGSFSYSAAEVSMRWIEKDPIHLEEHRRFLKEFYVADAVATRAEVPYPAGKWDELTMTFVIQRRYGWYILNVYVPTYLTVFVSWISFFLGEKAIPARTMIGVNSLLAMTFQFGSVIRNLPRVSYIKAIDVWMLSGMSFVFASLLELATVGYLARKRDQSQFEMSCDLTVTTGSLRHSSFSGRRRATARNLLGPRSPALNLITTSVFPGSAWLNALTPDDVDRCSSRSFPTLFVAFNIFYWLYYLTQTWTVPMADQGRGTTAGQQTAV